MTAEVSVGMADMKLGKEDDVLSTVLGSCVGLCLFSPNHRAGGLLHLMLPAAGDYAGKPDCKKAKYADTGVPELIQQIKKYYGIPSGSLVARMFGGAKVLKNVERNIGEDNAVAVRSILKEYGIPVKAYKLGGERGYRIKFNLDSGKVFCQVFGGPIEEF